MPSNMDRHRGADESLLLRPRDRQAEDVIPYLAKQERHWKRGCLGYELAHSWVNASGISAPVRPVLEACSDYADAGLVEGLFERDVELRMPRRRS